MGWDAGADGWRNHAKRFSDAAEEVRKLADSVDGYLEQGGLDCSNCKRMLEVATGQRCDDVNWSKEEVQQYAREAVWSFIFDASDAWAYWSARKFLELCAELGLAIYF